MTPRRIVPRRIVPRRIVLWRHGRTEWNLLGRAQGHTQIPLDDAGRAQARAAAACLASYRPAFIWSSDLIRASQTADELAARTGVPVQLDQRLREFDVGVRQGLTFEEFAERYPELYERWQRGHVDVPGAESAETVVARMLDVLDDATNAVEPEKTGVVVGHGAAIRAGLAAFLGLPPRRWVALRGMSNCGWAVIEEADRWGWRMVDYNAGAPPGPALSDELPG